ncbi:MAG: hypothetical protein WCL23_03070 [Candidatus Moraniibacteriota bacterium]
MNVRKIVLSVGIVFFLGVFVFAWTWIARSILFPVPAAPATPMVARNFVAVTPTSTPVIPQEAVPGSAPAESTPTSEIQEPKVFGKITEHDIRKGQVEWQEPKNLGNLKWWGDTVSEDQYSVNNGSTSYRDKYVKVGTVKKGKYSGAEIIKHDATYFLSLKGKIVLLLNVATRDGGQANVYTKDEQGAIHYGFYDEILIMAPNETIDDETRIEDLAEYPAEIKTSNSRVTLVRSESMYSQPEAFFTDAGLKPVFDHPELGQVWMADATKKRVSREELNSYMGTDENHPTLTKLYIDPVVDGGFYLKGPDGSFETYRLKLDVFDTFDRAGVLLATWKNGEKNTASYEEYPSGCGLGAYAYDMTGKVDIEKDLVKVGKTDQGDDLYGYKETNPDLKTYYTETYLSSLIQYAGPGQSADPTPGADTAANWAAFLQKHAIVFWVDPFGRILEFFNTDTMQLAECGKPVVYLYPEKTTDVSVKVFPNEGVSVSDPAYGDGWNVTAQPDGTLTNHADGLQYPNLFWEGGSSVIYKTPTRGFVTAREDLKMFFDGKLSELGLSVKEISDFEEYWISKMNEKPKPFYFVTFLSREQIDRLAPLSITPKPDTVIRVMMDYEGLDAWKDVPGYSIRTPKRQGFTAVEWGGRLK